MYWLLLSGLFSWIDQFGLASFGMGALLNLPFLYFSMGLLLGCGLGYDYEHGMSAAAVSVVSSVLVIFMIPVESVTQPPNDPFVARSFAPVAST